MPAPLVFDRVTVLGESQPLLQDVTVSIARGTVAALVSIDGRGTATFVRCAAGLEAPSSGTVRFEGRDVYSMSLLEDREFRRRATAVLELDGLQANRTIHANVAFPLRYHGGGSATEIAATAAKALEAVGYGEDLYALPSQVSARARRLAALARALVREPELVVIDGFFETIDVRDWRRVIELVLEINALRQTTFLVVGRPTPIIFEFVERVIVLEAGKVLAHDAKPGLYRNPAIKAAFEAAEERTAVAPASALATLDLPRGETPGRT